MLCWRRSRIRCCWFLTACRIRTTSAPAFAQRMVPVFTRVIAPKDRAVALTETVIRVAAGAAQHVPFVQVTNLARTLTELQGDGVRVVGTADDAKSTLYEADLTGPLAIAMGFEGSGLRRLTRERCDEFVRIPMSGEVDCLNVSVATGVCLFEAKRQRGPKPA